MLLLRCRCHDSASSRRPRVATTDAIRRRDPSGTAALSRAARIALNSRWRTLSNLLRVALVEQNLFGANGVTIGNIAFASTGGDRVTSFQRWFDEALRSTLMPDHGMWLKEVVAKAYDIGRRRARVALGRVIEADASLEPLASVAVVELQGVAEAVSQQVVRVFADGIVGKARPQMLFRAMDDRIRRVGSERGALLINAITVRAAGEATLDVFEAAGIKSVGVVAETVPAPLSGVNDAKKKSPLQERRLPKKKKARNRNKKRVSQKAKAAAIASGLELVEVLTAGDDKVCSICIELSDGGPYDIVDARGLIPAHPRCRCAFVPFFDARFAPIEHADAGFDPNQPRDPGGEGGGQWVSGGGDDDEGVARYLGDDPYENAIGINGKLRSGEELSASDQSTVEAMDRVIAKSPKLDKTTVFYRGSTEDVYLTKYPEANVDKGFLSMSASREVAEEFASQTRSGHGVVYAIHVPKGMRVLDAEKLQKHSGMIYQKEWILGRNSRLVRRGSTDKHNGHLVVFIDVLLNATSDEFNPNQPRAPKGSEKGGEWIGINGDPNNDDLDEAHEHEALANKTYTGPKKPLDAINNYTGGASEDINGYLRFGGNELDERDIKEVRGEIRSMDRVLDNSSLPRDVTVYRMISEETRNKILRSGDTFVDKGYTSTTTRNKSIKQGTLGREDTAIHWVKIVLPKGTNALPIMHLSYSKKEREVLVARNTRFRVTRRDHLIELRADGRNEKRSRI